jgi:hypothetical protein
MRLLTVLSLLASTATAFITIPKNNNVDLGLFQRRRVDHYDSRQFSLHALVYGADGKVIKEDQNEKPDSNKNRSIDLLEEIQSEITNDQLVRIACAFAPPPHTNIHPSKVHNAQLVSLTENKLDVAIAVPSTESTTSIDQQQLAQVLISIPLTDDEEEDIRKEKILEQIQQLDTVAVTKIAQQEKEQDETAATSKTTTILLTLQEEPRAIDWPDWWTVPELKIMLAEECTTLKSLLNTGEFDNELLALCAQRLDKSNKSVDKARVASIGPSGIFFRARLDDDKVIDVPIRFPEGERTTADDLRESVLTMIESVEEQIAVTPVAMSQEEISVPEKDSTETTTVVASEQKVEEVPGKEDEPVVVEVTADTTTDAEEEQPLSAEIIKGRRKQPKSPKEEARLATKYAAIEDLGERAYAILKYLAMI